MRITREQSAGLGRSAPAFAAVCRAGAALVRSMVLDRLDALVVATDQELLIARDTARVIAAHMTTPAVE
jgi:hypothetical protein